MRNFACVSHRRTRWGFFLGVIMLNKGANVCWCLISSKAQACGYALQYFPPLVVCQNASGSTSTSSESADDARRKSNSKRPKKRSKVASPAVKMVPDANVGLFLKNLGYQQYAGPLAEAGFTSMAELSLITAKALKAANVLEGHSLRILDHLKKRRALGVVPKAIPADFIAKRKARA